MQNPWELFSLIACCQIIVKTSAKMSLKSIACEVLCSDKCIGVTIISQQNKCKKANSFYHYKIRLNAKKP